MASSSGTNYGPSPASQEHSPPSQGPSKTDSIGRKTHNRQLLSCTKCRERKVKCDRTKPCGACCARGHPKECEFIVAEGNDYSLIQQSYEIRKLRQENDELKKRLARISPSGEDEVQEASSGTRVGLKTNVRQAAARQKMFRTEQIDNLYFGTPGLATIVSDFANLQVGSISLTHPVPKGRDIYASDSPSYPFNMVPNYTSISELLELLPGREELFTCLEVFQRRAQSCSFPHTPDEVTRREVERFLNDAKRNAERCPDMLALIFITLANGLQLGQNDLDETQWSSVATAEESRNKSDAYLTASMQALRCACFTNRPTLLGIQTLIMMGPYLTNSGRFLDAWTLFGTTIRLAHSIGLHRNPNFLEPVPDLRECNVRQTLWWWMLHMDQQYSVTLGRPLGISGIGDCPPPEPLTTNPTMLRLGEFIHHFTILARQILSSQDMTKTKKIDEFTDKLLGLWDTMPETLQFNQSWIQEETKLPDWPLEVMSASLFAKVQSLLILINRQRTEQMQNVMSTDGSPPSSITNPQWTGGGLTVTEPELHPAVIRGRALVINSSVAILHTFTFFRRRNPGGLICWTMCQHAFNACMILILDACESDTEWQGGMPNHEYLINQAFFVFQDLEKNGIHQLAKLATTRISDGLYQLQMRQKEKEAISRKPSAQMQGSSLSIDAAPLTDWTGDTLMGNTGMFLLEDPGLQSYVPPAFRPLGWYMPGNSGSPTSSSSPTISVPSTTMPVSQSSAAPFPILSQDFIHSDVLPMTNNTPFAVGLQPRMPRQRSGVAHHHPYNRPQQQGSVAAHNRFTPVNTTLGSVQQRIQPQRQQPNYAATQGLPLNQPSLQSHHQQIQQQLLQQQQQRQQQDPQSSSQVRASRQGTNSSSGGGSRGIHRLDKPPRSQQRRQSRFP